jgi:hypothetical protein
MGERAEFNERRKYQRSPVASGVIAVLITTSPEIIGSVSDISLGGARITYHHPINKAVDYSRLKVDLISDDRFVEAIPCTNAWDRAVETENFTANGDLRQCGIEFRDLTPNQLFLLRGFINRCALQKSPKQSPPDIPDA